MKDKLIILFLIILSGVICSCSGKEDLTPTVTPPSSGDNSGGGDNSGDGGNQDSEYPLPYEITYTLSSTDFNESHKYVLDYDGNGVIKSVTEFETTTDLESGESYSVTRKYDFIISVSTLVETYQVDLGTPENYSKPLSGGYIKSFSYPYGGLFNNYSWNYEYSSGYLTNATEKYNNSELMGQQEFFWSNNCLIKITTDRDDGNNAYSGRLELTYESDSNPYFGKNFDPMALLLNSLTGVEGYNSFEEMMVGLLGHNGNKLPKSAKEIVGSDNITYSFTYTFSNGALTNIKITPSVEEEYFVYEYNIKNKSFK